MVTITVVINHISSNQHADVYIFAAPADIVYPSSAIELFILEGDQMTLTCTARGFPAPEFTWYKASDLINGSDTRFQISSSEINVYTGHIQVTSSLNITIVDRTDFDTFRCVASNIVLGSLSNDSEMYDITVIGEFESATIYTSILNHL